MEVYLRDVVSGQTAWERLGALYLSEFVTAAGQPLAPTPVQDRRPLEIPVDVNADIRAREFAHLVVTHCHTCVGKYIATLDGRLRNAAHLVRHGVRPSTVLVIEREVIKRSFNGSCNSAPTWKRSVWSWAICGPTS